MPFMNVVLCVFLTLAFPMAIPVLGQTASSAPPLGDPNIVAMFLTYYDSLSADIHAEQQQDAVAAGTAEKSAASSIGGLSVSDFRMIGTIYATVKQQLQSIDAEGIAYVQSLVRAKQAPDISKLSGLAARRQAAIAAGIQSLQNSLSPTGWTALSSYINGDFSKGITRRLLK